MKNGHKNSNNPLLSAFGLGKKKSKHEHANVQSAKRPNSPKETGQHGANYAHNDRSAKKPRWEPLNSTLKPGIFRDVPELTHHEVSHPGDRDATSGDYINFSVSPQGFFNIPIILGGDNASRTNSNLIDNGSTGSTLKRSSSVPALQDEFDLEFENSDKFAERPRDNTILGALFPDIDQSAGRFLKSVDNIINPNTPPRDGSRKSVHDEGSTVVDENIRTPEGNADKIQTPSKKTRMHEVKAEEMKSRPPTPQIEPVALPRSDSDRGPSSDTRKSLEVRSRKSDSERMLSSPRKSLPSRDRSNSATNSSGGGRPRSNSKTFLGRRSFSPSSISKIIPIPAVTHNTSRRNSLSVSSSKGENFTGVTKTRMAKDRDENKGIKLKNVVFASKRKNHEFHSLFKNAAPEERLIQEHSCAYSKDILVQGRMYLSDMSVHFYSNILGWVTTVSIAFKDITSMEKKSTAGLIPNAIGIETLQAKYIFASFISRDTTFDFISDIWSQYTVGSRTNGMSDSESDSEFDSDGSAIDSDVESADTDVTSTDAKQTSGGTEVMGPTEHAPTTAEYSPQDNERKIYEGVVNAPMGVVANIMFGDDTNPLLEILKTQKNYDFTPIPKLMETKSRNYTYTKPLSGAIGPSKTKCIIEETIDNFDLEKYVQVTQMTKNPDVPSGNSFQVKTTYLLSWDANNSTKLVAYVGVVWSGKSWIKGAIEKGSFDGVTDTTKTMVSEINKMVAKKPKKARKAKETEEEEEEESTLPKLEPYSHAPTTAKVTKEKNDTVIEENVNIPAPMTTVYQLMFGDDTSYLKNIVEKQNNFNLSEIPKFQDNKREYNYIKKLNNSIGPKQTKCFITEEIKHQDFEDYVEILQVSKTPDVPSGNSFEVHSKIYISWGEKNTSVLTVLTNIAWSGKSFLKGAIEKGSIDGQKGSTKVLIEQLGKIISSAGTKKSKRKSKHKKGSSTNQEEEEEEEEAGQQVDEQEGAVSGGIFDTISSLFGPITENLDITSTKTLIPLVISVFLILLWMLGVFSSRGVKYNMTITRPGRIVIDGNEFAYAPTMRTLYDAYAENIKITRKSCTNPSNIVTETESTLWDWINDRGDAQLHSIDEFIYPDVDDTVWKHVKETPKINDHNLQELAETIKVAERQLQQMQKNLAELQVLKYNQTHKGR